MQLFVAAIALLAGENQLVVAVELWVVVLIATASTASS
jgi:hypothetical protein